ncbi:MAG: T9SS type A sorting domain-containing protein [Flavobacteriales bacterium]|nr:T9SS type A sorting domain-containing protein [Flavobacteriales bacterium]
MNKKLPTGLLAIFSLCLTANLNTAQAQGFNDSPINWSTPFPYENTAQSGSWKWATMDMNGDGLPDLVDTYYNEAYGSPGDYHWEVYLNEGDGFSSTVLEWNIPYPYEYITGSGSWRWVTVDMNGDGRPDLVDVYFNEMYGTAGDLYWEVYLNTGTGFETTPIEWSVPWAYEHFSGSVSSWNWTVMDMNGDGMPDIVDTYLADFYGSPGDYHWEVYLNEGDGFSSTVTEWDIPGEYSVTANASGGSHWTTMDIDGDKRPDLVDTYYGDTYGPTSGKYWKVYKNTGDGFSSGATVWSTPYGYSNTAWFSGVWRYSTIDVNGDDLPDLVDTYYNDFYSSGGGYYWEVYLNEGDGFSSTVTQWSTPKALEITANTFGSERWVTMDMNGDKIADLVEPYDGGVFGSPGAYYWKVYINDFYVGVDENLADEIELTVYPNPANDQINITSDQPITEVQFVNTIGETVLTVESEFTNIDISELPVGMYVLQITTEVGIISRKIVKQ